jgi:hypothetical protein
LNAQHEGIAFEQKTVFIPVFASFHCAPLTVDVYVVHA